MHRLGGILVGVLLATYLMTDWITIYELIASILVFIHLQLEYIYEDIREKL